MTKRQALGEGKTIEEAIAAALAELGAARDQVEVEILQEPARRGLLRRKAQPAQVRLTLKAVSYTHLLSTWPRRF